MRSLALLVAVGLVGCGGDGARDALAGTDWAIDWSDGCETVAAFGDTGTYTLGLGCPQGDGSIALQQEVGNYSVSGDRLTTTPTRATCANATADTVSFSMTATALTIHDPNGVLSFSRVTATGGGSGVGIYGCFLSDGTFAKQPLAPL